MIATVPLHRLSLRQRRVVEKLESGDSPKDIAVDFGIGRQAVYGRIKRARKRLTHAEIKLTVLDYTRAKQGQTPARRFRPVCPADYGL